jgi:flagellar biosynthesis/type III secretory pathway M-ring protein FliF/YscJ
MFYAEQFGRMAFHKFSFIQTMKQAANFAVFFIVYYLCVSKVIAPAAKEASGRAAHLSAL